MNALVAVETAPARDAGDPRCWRCCPPDVPITADQSTCARCLAASEESKRLAAQAKADELAAAAAKEQGRHDDDMRSVDGYLKDRRRADFDKNWRG